MCMYITLMSIFSLNILLGIVYWFKRINDSQYELLGIAIFPYSFFIVFGINKIRLCITNHKYWAKRYRLSL